MEKAGNNVDNFTTKKQFSYEKYANHWTPSLSKNTTRPSPDYVKHDQSKSEHQPELRNGHHHGHHNRSFLQKNAFFITMLLNSMIDNLGNTARTQYRYKFFESQFAHELQEFNVSTECSESRHPEVNEIENTISRETAQWALYSDYVTIVPQMLTALVMGLKSDQIGRRFVFLYPIFTSFVDFSILAVTIELKLHFGLTLVGDFMKSLSGGASAMHFAAYAIISDTHGKKREEDEDCKKPDETSKILDKHGKEDDDSDNDLDVTREKQRTFKIVLLHIGNELASGLVLFVTGYVIESVGFFYTACITLGLKFLLFIFAFVFITETGEQKKSPGFIAPLKTLLETTKNPRNRCTLLLVNMAIVFLVVSRIAEKDVMTIYQMSPPFCMDSVHLGYLSSETRLKGIFAIPVLWLQRRLHFMESTIAAVGMYSDAASNFVLAIIRQTWVFFVVPIIAIPGALSSSMTKAITTRLVGRQALASTFALILVVEELFSFGGAQAGNYLYQHFVDTLPTAPFYLASSTFVLSAVLYTAETMLQRRYGTTDAQREVNVVQP